MHFRPAILSAMDLNRILREGLHRHGASCGRRAVWFLVVDLINGQPLFTPAHARECGILGATGFGTRRRRARPHLRLHDDSRQRVRRRRLRRRRPRAEVEYAPSTLFLVIVGFCSSKWVLHPRRIAGQAVAGLSGLVERGDRQWIGRVGNGLLPLARASPYRRRASPSPPRRDRGRRVASSGTFVSASAR